MGGSAVNVGGDGGDAVTAVGGGDGAGQATGDGGAGGTTGLAGRRAACSRRYAARISATLGAGASVGGATGTTFGAGGEFGPLFFIFAVSASRAVAAASLRSWWRRWHLPVLLACSSRLEERCAVLLFSTRAQKASV